MSADEQVPGLSDQPAPPPEAAASPAGRQPTSPFDCLDISTPLEELEAFARARIEALVRTGDAEGAERAGAALELGRRALRDVLGGGPR